MWGAAGVAAFALLLAIADVGRTSVGPISADPDFDKYREQFLTALAAGESDRVLDLLERGNQYDNAEFTKILMKYCVQHEDFLVHRHALQVLGGFKSTDSLRVLVEIARDSKEWEQRAHALRVLSFAGGPLGAVELEKALDDKKWQVRSAAYRGLARFRQRHSIELLINGLEKEKGRLLADIQWSLEQLTGEGLQANYRDWKNWWDRVSVGGYLVPSAEEVAKMMKKDEAKDVRTAVAEGLYGPIYSEKVAFLIDISGSMQAGTETQGTRLEIAVRELSRVLLDQVTKDTYFNVLAFSEEVHPFHRRLTRGSSSKVKKSIEMLEKLESGGETNAYGALKAAFADPDVDTIYLLSDGVPTVGEQSIPQLILMDIETWNRDRRVIINTIGFFPGDAKNQDKIEAREFLRNLAHAHEGFYKEIY